MLAVGGGGDCGGSGNGGGSGYIPYMDTPLEDTFRNLTIQVAVGRGGQPSEIAIDHAVVEMSAWPFSAQCTYLSCMHVLTI